MPEPLVTLDYEALLSERDSLKMEVERLRKEKREFDELRKVVIFPGDCVEIVFRAGPDSSDWYVWANGNVPGCSPDPGEAFQQAIENAERACSTAVS